MLEKQDLEDILELVELLENSPCVPDVVWMKGKTLINSTLIPKVAVGNDRPLQEKDFGECSRTIEDNLSALKCLLKKIINKLSVINVSAKVKSDKEFILLLILVCGEHRTQDKWTTGKTITICEDILCDVCQLMGCNNISVLLNDDELGEGIEVRGLFKAGLVKLRPKLLKTTWKCYPAAVACYKWMLLQVKCPHLGEHLSAALPTALLLVDDISPENTLHGIQCLQHIVENLSRTELGWYGQAKVIHMALQPNLYQREAMLVGPLVTCLLAVLNKMEPRQKCFQWGPVDDVVKIMLQMMYQEDDLALRMAHSDSLRPLLEALGPGVLRWSRQLLPIFQDDLEVAGHLHLPLAKPTLLNLQTYLTHGWPRIANHFPALTQMLLKVLYDVSEKAEASEDLLRLIEESLVTLVKCAPRHASDLKQELKQVNFNPTFNQVVSKTIFQTWKDECSIQHSLC